MELILHKGGVQANAVAGFWVPDTGPVGEFLPLGRRSQRNFNGKSPGMR
ncbi:hypothetical protein [Litoreibacter ponti]|nr:hypothetical protein [Litoreibacter ponti]